LAGTRCFAEGVISSFEWITDAEAEGKVLLNENDVEVCCLLERLRNAKDHVTFTLDMEDYYRIKDAEADKEKR